MKTNLSILILALGMLTSEITQAGQLTGNGGGGVKRDGLFLTFGSEKVKLFQTPLKTVPGLEALKLVVEKIPLPQTHRGTLATAIYPIGKRQYYAIQAEDLTETKRVEIKLEYFKAMQERVAFDDLVIYAYTNTTDRETFLLPEFFEISGKNPLGIPEDQYKEIRQVAILFHEGIWMLRPDLSYREIFRGEILFENYLAQNPHLGFDTHLFAYFNKIFGDPIVALMSAAQMDHASGKLTPLLNQAEKIPMTHLFGEDLYIECRSYHELGHHYRSFRLNTATVQAFLITQMRRYPEISFLGELYSLLDQVSLITYSRNGMASCEEALWLAKMGSVSLDAFRSIQEQKRRVFNVVAYDQWTSEKKKEKRTLINHFEMHLGFISRNSALWTKSQPELWWFF